MLPEFRLFYAIVESAILDLPLQSSVNYLSQETIPELDICGVDTEWVQRVLRKANLIGE